MAKRLDSNPSTPAKQAGISGRRILYLMAFTGLCGILILQLFSGETKAPLLVSPEDHTLIRGYEGQDISLTIKWNHGGITRDRLFPSRATRFVVCFFEHNTICIGDGTDALFVSEQTTAIPRTMLGAPSSLFYSLVERLYPRYEYTYDVVLPASVLNNPLYWTVYACSGGTQLENCTFARPVHELGVSNRNLVATRIDDETQYDDSSFVTGIKFLVELKNEGDTTNEPYQIWMRVWEILHDSSGAQPLTDLMQAAAYAASTVITLDGKEAPIAEFRNGNRSDLFAIKKPGTVSTPWSVTYQSVPNPNDNLPTSVKPCGIPDPDPCEVKPHISNQPALFAAFYKIDPNNLLLEFNEDDNVKMLRTIR